MKRPCMSGVMSGVMNGVMSGVMSGMVLTMAGAVWSAESTAEALRFASGSPELRTLAEAWRDHGDDLLQASSSEQAINACNKRSGLIPD